MNASTAVLDSTILDELDKELEAQIIKELEPEMFGLSRFLGNNGRWCTVTKECMPQLRSEERRVGKECRSRWSPYH